MSTSGNDRVPTGLRRRPASGSTGRHDLVAIIKQTRRALRIAGRHYEVLSRSRYARSSRTSRPTASAPVVRGVQDIGRCIGTGGGRSDEARRGRARCLARHAPANSARSTRRRRSSSAGQNDALRSVGTRGSRSPAVVDRVRARDPLCAGWVRSGLRSTSRRRSRWSARCRRTFSTGEHGPRAWSCGSPS